MKMHTKKIILALLGISLISNFFVGCTTGDETSNNGSGPSAENTKITVWAMGEEGKMLPQLTEAYEKDNPGITVEVQAIPWDQAHEKLITAVADSSDNGPDIVTMGTSWIPEFADAGALADLAPYVTKYPSFSQENYFDSSLETATFDDVYVGVPWYVDTRVLYYRTDLLEQVGYPNGPSNWDELKDASTKLAARGENLYGIDIDAVDQFFPTMLAWQNGTDVVENGKAIVNQPKYVEAITFLNSFFKQGLVEPQKSDMDIMQAFKEGVKPMFFSGPWMLNLIAKDIPEVADQYDVRVVPGNVSNTSFVGGTNLVLWESSNQKDAAAALMDYLLTPQTQIEWFKISNTLPSRTEAWKDQALADDPKLSVFADQMTQAKSSPFLLQWENIAQEIILSMERINVSGAEIQPEMDALNKKIDDLLAQE